MSYMMMLIFLPVSTTGRSAYIGHHESSRTNYIDIKELAAKGFVPEICVAFAAYGWRYGKLFADEVR